MAKGRSSDTSAITTPGRLPDEVPVGEDAEQWDDRHRLGDHLQDQQPAQEDRGEPAPRPRRDAGEGVGGGNTGDEDEQRGGRCDAQRRQDRAAAGVEDLPEDRECRREHQHIGTPRI